jgi:hypothetical protein
MARAGTWDPKRFYKSNDSTKLPKHFSIGTVVEGAADFYSSRLNRKERQQSITGEVRGACLNRVIHSPGPALPIDDTPLTDAVSRPSRLSIPS